MSTTAHPARIFRGQRLPEDTPRVPVLIVGGGACGMTAAVRLRLAGIDCVVLERDALPQGSTALSSGFIPAAETRLQKALGIEDSIELFARDVQAKAHGRAASHLVQAYTEGVARAIDMLEAQGITFEILQGFSYPGHSALRMHAVPERTGAALIAAMERTASSLGADILTEALVREIWLGEGDRVIGVGLERGDGSKEYIACDALILACNGFGGNTAMVRELLPEMTEAAFGGHVGNDGSAIAWGRALGARLADLTAYQGHGSWVTPQGALMTWAFIMEGGVQINSEGQRFHDETQGYSEAAGFVLKQPGAMAWNVLDGPLLDLVRTFPDFVEAEKAGALRSASDLAALAALIGCDAQVLAQTLAEVAPGRPDAFGRSFKRSLQAPYYAVKVTGALFHTQGGLDIDAQCRVLAQGGQALPNLLAAGGAARGVSGDAVWGYMSGNGLLSALGGGWTAAGTVAEQLTH
jgi:fumarate reductase flavoprotein subunit